MNAGNGASFTLQWSEPRAIFPTVGRGGFTDLNIYVMNAALTQCLGQSTNAQTNGVGDTIEQVALPAALNGTAAKVVLDVQGTSSAAAAPLLDLRWRTAAAVDNTTRAGAMNPDSNYTNLATASAAVQAPGGGLEGFSSGGPVTLVSTTVCPGGSAGPCTGQAGAAATVAQAPDWAAADGVTVSGVGGFGSPFFGTSAAAPHAAGCDALLRDALNNAAAAPATTNARLAATAVDINAPGVDNNTGAGRLDCLAAVNNPPTAEAGGPYSTPEGTDVTVDGTGSSDPDAGDSIATYEWDLDNDGSYDDATGSTATFDGVGQDGSFTVGLRVTDQARATGTDTATVNVNNVAPSVTVGSDGPKDETTTVTVSGSVTDPGWEDDLTATIDWGDGTGAQPLAGTQENARPDAELAFSDDHVYGDNGTFTVTVCAADDDTSNNCNSTPVQMDNVDPVTGIDETGTTLINGIPTFLAHAGEPIDFSAQTVDPGSDDLFMTWDWDDGPPSPDESSTSLVNAFPDPPLSPSIQPRDVVYPTTHAFGDACLYSITFSSTDDDGGTNSDLAKVIITGNAGRTRSAGYWQNQYRDRNHNVFAPEVLDCYLEITGYMSTVFNEATNASTFDLARDVLKVGGGTTARQQFDRQLLAVWLNFSNGSVDFDEALDVMKDGVPDGTLAAIVGVAESVRLNPASSTAAINSQMKMMERINMLDGG